MLRLIQEFMIALQKMLEKKEIETKQQTLKKLYQQFVGDATFYRLEPIEEILKALKEMPEDERLGKQRWWQSCIIMKVYSQTIINDIFSTTKRCIFTHLLKRKLKPFLASDKLKCKSYNKH